MRELMRSSDCPSVHLGCLHSIGGNQLKIDIDRVAAWTGAIVSFLSLTWNMATWKSSRHKVKIKLTNVLYKDGSGKNVHLLCITCTNSGKDPISVTNWGIRLLPDKQLGNFRPHPWSSKVPSEISNVTNARFFVHADELWEICQDQRMSTAKLRPWIELSNGSTVSSKKRVPL